MKQRSSLGALWAVAAALIALSIGDGHAAEPEYAVQIVAPKDLRTLLEDNLRVVRVVRKGTNQRRFERLTDRAEIEIRELLATEGYFSPTVKVDIERGEKRWTARYTVTPGEPSLVSAVEIRFQGRIAEDRWDNAQRRTALRASWPLQVGDRFRQAQWNAGKDGLVRALLDERYPLAKVAASEARVDPTARSVALSVVVDSGPSVTLGALRISGLERYPESIVHDLNRIAPGTPYSQKQLSDFQRDLLETSYFTSAFVTADVDAAHPDDAPIDVTVVEAPRRRLKAGIGYSTDVGFKVETVYTQREFFTLPWQWTSGLRLAQREQGAFSEVLTPRDSDGHRYGVGLLFLNTDIQNERTRSATMLLRRLTPGREQESEFGLAPIQETKEIGNVTTENLTSVPVYVSWTRRKVDNLLNPRDGWLLNLQAAAAVDGALSDESFFNAHGKLAAFFPVGKRDTLIGRIELGRTWASNPAQVPSTYLFRTGGANSVRGYSYESLGVKVGDATTGGRVLGVASAEYVHMLTDEYGVAAFIDAGDAANSVHDYDLKLGYGVGFRWKSPIGPLAIDAAYGEAVDDYRIHLIVGYTF
jgi:translocation and assembly module TamA